MQALIRHIFDTARRHGLSQAHLAAKAGVRPETLSRLKHRKDCDVRTLQDLALAVGYQLALVPLSRSQAYSPRKRAEENARSRRRDEQMIAAGKISREEIQRRNGFFSLSGVRFSPEGLPDGGNHGKRKRARKKRTNT